jgi:hypothetical protein
VVSEDPVGPAVLPTTDPWQWFTETAHSRAPAWRNEVTLRSVEMFLEYEPDAHIAHISPTPLMMVVALGDHLTVADEALAAYERALEPKRHRVGFWRMLDVLNKHKLRACCCLNLEILDHFPEIKDAMIAGDWDSWRMVSTTAGRFTTSMRSRSAPIGRTSSPISRR